MPARQATRMPVDSQPRNDAYGRLLRTRRDAVGLTQVEIAHIISVSRATIGSAERGLSMQNRTHHALLCALGCEPNVQNFEDLTNARLDELLAPRVAGIAARSVLEHRQKMISFGYFELVTKLARRQFGHDQLRICNELVAKMSIADAELFDAELAVLLGAEYPVRWVDGRRTPPALNPGASDEIRHPGRPTRPDAAVLDEVRQVLSAGQFSAETRLQMIADLVRR